MLRNSFDFSKSLLKIALIHAILVQSPISVASSYRPPPKAPGAPDFKTGQEAPESASQKFLDGEGKPVTAKIVSDGILLEFSDPNQESILIEKSSEEELKKVSPDAIRASAIEGAKSAGQHIRDGFAEAYRSFPMEALAFYTVMGAMAVYECWYKMRTNPMACDDFVKQLVDPVAQLSFYLFIATSKSVGNMVNGLNLAHYKKTGRFLLGKNLRHIIPYLGMAAGSLVSQISVEMWSDPNITYVRENMFSFDGQFGNKIDQEKYYKALFEAAKKWMNPGNLTAYAPHVLSLAFSMASASIVTGVAAAGLAKAGITQAYKQWERAAIKQFIRTSLSYGKDSAKYIWRMRGLRFTLRAGGFLLTVASFAHFFLWEHYYGPPITKWWNQEETAMKLRYYESAIADTLAEARSNSDEEFVENYTNIRRFLYDAIHTDSDISAQRKFLSENADDFGLTDSDVLDVDRLFMKQRNQNYIVRNHDYNEDLSPTLVQVPFLYSEKANKTFSKVPNFAMVTDPGKFNLLGSVVHKSRYDHLLNQIRDYITQVDSYQAALGSLFELTRNKWDEFFKPFTAWSLTTFQLYRHLVEMKKQRLFDKEDFWKSKSMIDALYLNSRPLDNSSKVDTRRLMDENSLIQMGLNRTFVQHQPSGNLRYLMSRLWNQENTGFLGGKTPTLYRVSMIEYLNRGFNVIGVNTFKKFDYQIRIQANDLGASVKVLDSMSTRDIDRFVSFVKSRTEWNRAYFPFALNSGWPLEKVLSSTPDQISEAFGGEQSIQNQIQNFGKDEQTNYALRMASRGTQILADGAEYYDDDMSLNSTNLTESGVAYQSTVVKLLIQAACGKRIEELQHDIGWRNGFWVMLGSLRFTAPRLVKSDQNVCHSIAYTPYKSFWVTENGKDVHYYNILDYVLRNIPDDLTVEKFDSEWWPHVLSYSEEVYKGYKEKEKTAFDEQIEKAFYDPSYGRFLKLDDMTKVGNPLTGASFLHPILTSTSDPFIRRKMYANGIRQFAVDTSDYLIRVIVSMLPHEDPEFTDRVYYILENIQELTGNVGTDFESLLQNSTWKQYANHIIQSELDSIDNEKEYVAAGLQFAMYRTPDYHRLALHHRIDELKFAIKNEFQRRNASNTYTRAITRALDLILDQVEAQVGHASMLQTMTPRSFKVPVSSQPEKSRPIDPSNIEVILGPGQIEPKDTDTITNKNFENEIEIIQGENQ